MVRRIQPATPTLRYRAESHAVVENEICPVYLATTDEQPHPDPAEVGRFRRTAWPQFLADLEQYSSSWRLQTGQPELHQAVQRPCTDHLNRTPPNRHGSAAPTNTCSHPTSTEAGPS